MQNGRNKLKHSIGIVPQDLAIYEEISAEKNVSFFASLYGLRGQKLKERTAFALDLVGLTDKRKNKPKTFSGGMKGTLSFYIILHSLYGRSRAYCRPYFSYR